MIEKNTRLMSKHVSSYSSIFCLMCCCLLTAPLIGQSLEDDLNGTLSLGGSTSTGITDNPAFGVEAVSQIAFDPSNNNRVFASTFSSGIWSFDYDPNGVSILSNANQILPAGSGIAGSLGIALHQDASLGTVLYLAPSVPFQGASGIPVLANQSIVRLTDANGDGTWGGSGDLNQTLIDNISVNQHHQVDQLKVQGDQLFVAIGTKTQFGGINIPDPGEAAHNGTVSFIGDLNQLSATATNQSAFTYVDLTGDGAVDNSDVRADTQAFTSNDDIKLRVYSTGFRNPYGIAFSPDGNLFVAQNSQDDEDKLYQAFFQSDHGFAKENNVVGDWRVDGDSTLAADPSSLAIGAGYFDTNNNVDPLAFLGNRTSANGFDFLTNTVDPSLEGDILISRFNPDGAGPQFDSGDIVHVDSLTGDSTVVVDGVIGILDTQRDPFGNFLFSDSSGNFGVLLVDTNTVPAQTINLDTAADATYFVIDPASDNRVNIGVNRIGGSNDGNLTFETYMAFDISGSTVADLQAASFDLVFTPGAFDNDPPLDDMQIDYLGTFNQGGDDADFGANGPNGASAFAQSLNATPVVTGLGTFQPTVDVENTFNADAIATDSFINQFAIFRITDPSFAGQQWNIPADSAVLIITPDTSPVLLGDANCDGEVNFDDIGPFIMLLASEDFKAQADVNLDGEVNFEDISTFISILSSL